jgi:hypothetical protein
VVAGSQLRKLVVGLEDGVFVESASESLARAIIAESSLEEVWIMSTQDWSALLHTPLPVRNLNFHTVSETRELGATTQMTVNRKWKPLLTANVLLALWLQILEKAHASPETSHGPAGILFHLLRERPDLVH